MSRTTEPALVFSADYVVLLFFSVVRKYIVSLFADSERFTPSSISAYAVKESSAADLYMKISLLKANSASLQSFSFHRSMSPVFQVVLIKQDLEHCSPTSEALQATGKNTRYGNEIYGSLSMHCGSFRVICSKFFVRDFRTPNKAAAEMLHRLLVTRFSTILSNMTSPNKDFPASRSGFCCFRDRTPSDRCVNTLQCIPEESNHE